MIEKIIDFSVNNRFIILIIYLGVIGYGVYSMINTPVDAIPDLSENQVIVWTEWMGRSPQIVEDQITYPLTTSLQGMPKVKAVRSQSMFGMSFIYVIFEDNAEVYWARSRVLEKLSQVQSSLPEGVTPVIGPDGTGVGHVYWYHLVSDKYDLGELRALQDYYLKLGLQSVEGVAEVASVGGFVKQYQIDADPNRLSAYGLGINELAMAVQRSNKDVGGRNIESSDIEYFVRGKGYITDVSDIEEITLKSGANGIPVKIKDVATVQIGGDIRRGMLDLNGEGEVVGGIIVMRYGENAQTVIDRVKEKLIELEKGLPEGIEIQTSYDRSDLISKAISTLRDAIIEEAIIVSLIVLVFLFHFKSALRILIEIPVAILISFILMRQFGITSNIMSLGGLIISIGILVDASIVMVENAYRNIAIAQEKGEKIDYKEISAKSAKQVGRAIFFSEAIIIISFLPVFMLEGQEGKLFHPLAFTKTFAIAGSALITITLVPMLMTLFMKGKFFKEEQNPVSRFFSKIYDPILRLALKYRKTTLGINVIALLITIPLIMNTGSEFMPPLDEGSLLFMPTMLPNVSITEAKRVLQVQDAIIKSIPEVESVLGKVGRAETPTDPAPVSMIETIIILKDKSEWREGITKAEIVKELNSKLQIPGVSNGWTQPIINRINMLSTGIRTDLGIKIFGDNLDTLEKLAIKAENLVKNIPGAADVYAERTQGGSYIDIDINREAISRYGLNVGDIQDVIEMAIGGENLTTTVEGRRRFPVRVRYMKDYRSDVEAIKNIWVTIPGSGGSNMPGQNNEMTSGRQVPLGELVDINITSGPPMISSEDALLRSVVFLNVRDRDMGSFVNEAKEVLDKELSPSLPGGYYYTWSGQWENQIRAKKRLQIILPIVFLIIFVMLYFTFNNFLEAGLVMLSVPFALIGGVYYMAILDLNFSVAIWVGFIALYGVAVETGVIMVLYLHEALDKKLIEKDGNISQQDLMDATENGAILRLRPKLMTVATALLGLIPVMWATGTGADLAKPLAVPLIGGIITSAIHVLFVTPVIFVMIKEYYRKKGKLKKSEMSKFMVQ
ncbi:MAG TPA: CusA/CzcA family heavy metal efflux RND transporter [Ignavibacteria bacterium]|nr:CusA/CzcA family heavy metal efflux RND transporter [Ignavibacteria bacterium]HQY52720.1 CusA/CzcA family heavy metal efflux RND transporter [Ignavibacteria bacterium]HRB01034.1 CusA/CzcA family heavy metal efflux RND transporter [Ignavibacteria bacterium]